MKKLLVLFLFTILKLSVYAQPIIQWQKCLGGTGADDAWSVQQTMDGGFVLAGNTSSNDGDVNGQHGLFDIWVVKLNSSGIIQWQKCLGGTGGEEARSIHQTMDGGYIIAGYTYSNDGDVSGNHGGADVWVVKLDGFGNLQWQKCFGGSLSEDSFSIHQTMDGGYVLAGQSNSNNGDVFGIHGNVEDIWVVKLNSSGIIQWQKCLGGSAYDYATSIQQTSDGGFILTGYTQSNDGDVSGNHGSTPFVDAWVVKLTSTGIIEWQKSLGGTSDEIVYSIQQTTDGGYVLAGTTSSNDGDVSGNHGSDDLWVVKMDSLGTIQWQKCLGGTSSDVAYSIQKTTDGGYVISGQTMSNNGDVSGFYGYVDMWVIKLNSLGIVQWQKCLGGTSHERALSIQQTTDGGYVLAGNTSSNDGDVSGNHGGFVDFWVVKLSSTVGMNDLSYIQSLNVFPNPTNDEINIQVDNTVVGSTYQLTDIIGRPIASGIITDEKSRISLQGLSSGTYLLSIGDEIRKTLKVVKE